MSANLHIGHTRYIEYTSCIVSYRIDSTNSASDTILVDPDPLLDLGGGPRIYCETCKRYIAPDELGLSNGWKEENTA